MVGNVAVGQILEGKVTGIQPYGAFVALNDDIQGLVHISEVTHGYVKDIHDHLKVGDVVQVKVLNINEEEGKYSLSIRAAEEPPKKQQTETKQSSQPKEQSATNSNAGFNTLKNKLEDWIKQSKEREETYRS